VQAESVGILKGIDCKDYAELGFVHTRHVQQYTDLDRPPDAECHGDTRSYNIYIAAQVGDDFQLYVRM